MWSVALRGPCCGGLNAVRVPHRRQKRHCCAHHVAAHNSVHRRAPDWRIVARINRHGATMGCPWVGERSVNCPSAKNLPSSSASRRYGRREAHRRPSWSPTSLRIRARSSGWNIAVPRTILRATFRLTNASPAASTANNSSLSGAPNPPACLPRILPPPVHAGGTAVRARRGGCVSGEDNSGCGITAS